MVLFMEMLIKELVMQSPMRPIMPCIFQDETSNKFPKDVVPFWDGVVVVWDPEILEVVIVENYERALVNYLSDQDTPGNLKLGR